MDYFETATTVVNQHGKRLRNQKRRYDEIDQIIRAAALVLRTVMPTTPFAEVAMNQLREAFANAGGEYVKRS